MLQLSCKYWHVCLCVCVGVCADLQDAAGDVRGDLGVRRVLVFALRLQVVLQTRLPEGHERGAMPLHRARLSDRRGDASDADLHHCLVIVISHVILKPAK